MQDFILDSQNTIGEKLTEIEAYNLVESIYDYYCEVGNQGEKLGFVIDRLTIEEFKKGVYKILIKK